MPCASLLSAAAGVAVGIDTPRVTQTSRLRTYPRSSLVIRRGIRIRREPSDDEPVDRAMRFVWLDLPEEFTRRSIPFIKWGSTSDLLLSHTKQYRVCPEKWSSASESSRSGLAKWGCTSESCPPISGGKVGFRVKFPSISHKTNNKCSPSRVGFDVGILPVRAERRACMSLKNKAPLKLVGKGGVPRRNLLYVLQKKQTRGQRSAGGIEDN